MINKTSRWHRWAVIILGTIFLGTGVGLAGEVIVTGEGLSQDAALRDALRKALERGGKVEIASRSQVENFELIRDTIYARADGVITDYRVIEETKALDGSRTCTISANVDQDAVATSWGEVQNVLDQIGRPGIAVYIQERIDGQLQDGSILETQIERRLLEAGFRVFAGDQLRAVAEKESADAAAEGDVAKALAVAKTFGTQIFITGTAQANAAGVRILAGQPTAMYNCDAAIKMFYTDTGELLASEALPNTRGGARGERELSPQAGKRALELAGVELVERCYQSVMRRWATRVTAGREIILRVSGVSLLDALKLKRKLEAMDPERIRSVNQSLTKGSATFRIQAKMSAVDLAAILSSGDWADEIEIVDLKTNRIQARKVE